MSTVSVPVKRKLPTDAGGADEQPSGKKAKVVGKTFKKQVIVQQTAPRNGPADLGTSSSSAAPLSTSGPKPTISAVAAPSTVAGPAAAKAAPSVAPKSAAAKAPVITASKGAVIAPTKATTGKPVTTAPSVATKTGVIVGKSIVAATAAKPAVAAASKPAAAAAAAAKAVGAAAAAKPAAAGKPAAAAKSVVAAAATKPAVAAAAAKPAVASATKPVAAAAAAKPAAAAAAAKPTAAAAAVAKPTAAAAAAKSTAAAAAAKPTAAAAAAKPVAAAAAAAAAKPAAAAAAAAKPAAAKPAVAAKSAVAAAATKPAVASAAVKPAAAATVAKPAAAAAAAKAVAATAASKPAAAAKPTVAKLAASAATTTAKPTVVAAGGSKPTAAAAKPTTVAGKPTTSVIDATKPTGAPLKSTDSTVLSQRQTNDVAAAAVPIAVVDTCITPDVQAHTDAPKPVQSSEGGSSTSITDNETSMSSLSQFDVSAFGSQIPNDFINMVMAYVPPSMAPPPNSMPPLEYATQDPRRELDPVPAAATTAAAAAAADPSPVADIHQLASDDANHGVENAMHTAEVPIDAEHDEHAMGDDDVPVDMDIGADAADAADTADTAAAGDPHRSSGHPSAPAPIVSRVGDTGNIPRPRISLKTMLANFHTGTHATSSDVDTRASLDRLHVRNDLLFPDDHAMVRFNDALNYDERKEAPVTHVMASTTAASTDGAASTADVENFYRPGFAPEHTLNDLIDRCCDGDQFWDMDVRVRDFALYLELILIFSGYNRNALHRNGHYKSLQRTLEAHRPQSEHVDNDRSIRTMDNMFTSEFPFDQPEHGAPPIRVPFFSVLPRSFAPGHLAIIESERCTMSVKPHGRHFNLCFANGSLYTNNRIGAVRRLNAHPGALDLDNTSYVVDAELTMQDRGSYIDAVFHMFPAIVTKMMRDEILTPRTQRDNMKIRPTWIIDDQHAECDALADQIRSSLLRRTSQDSLSLSHDGKPIRLFIVSKQWFSRIEDMRRFLTGHLQLYNDDPCFPYEYLHHPTHPHLSCPVDGRIFNLLGPVGADPPEIECRPDTMMDSIIEHSRRDTHKLHERYIPSRSAVVMPHRSRVTTERFLAMQSDPHFAHRVRVVKFKRVLTLDLRIMNTLLQRDRLLRDSATTTTTVNRRDVHYILACLNTVSRRQLDGVKAPSSSDHHQNSSDSSSNGYTFDQYVGMGVPHTDSIAQQLWTAVVEQGRSIIVECALYRGAFFIQSVRKDKHEPNHAASVLPSILCAAATQHMTL